MILCVVHYIVCVLLWKLLKHRQGRISLALKADFIWKPSNGPHTIHTNQTKKNVTISNIVYYYALICVKPMFYKLRHIGLRNVYCKLNQILFNCSWYTERVLTLLCFWIYENTFLPRIIVWITEETKNWFSQDSNPVQSMTRTNNNNIYARTTNLNAKKYTRYSNEQINPWIRTDNWISF